MIPYSYEIIKVDQQARVMEVVYTSPGRQTMRISARLPFVGESLEAVVDAFGPVAYWREQEAAVVVPALGTGSVGAPTPAPVTLSTAKRDKLAEIAQWRYERETSGVLFQGIRVRTDRESQATINGAFASLQAGLIDAVDWKASGDVWITLGLPEMTAIAQAVATHVQTSFSLEKQLAAELNALTTIEAVRAFEVPDVA
jgi:Domain of unknown function (DUF4376)